MLTHDQLVRLCAARDALRVVGEPELCIDDVAKVAAMSRFHFVRQFKALFGETPVQCRTGARLARAKQMLANSDDSITDICMAIGFSSLGSFSALFTQRVGLSPSAYRTRCRATSKQQAPACMEMLHAFWTHESQIRRSDDP